MTTLQLPTDHYLAGSINVVHLKHRLGDVKTDRLNRCIDSSSESWELYQPPLPWHSRAGGGAVHSIISRHMQCGKPALLFDHLVSAQEEISTDRQSERSRCFEIDDKLEFGGLLNRQVGRLRAFQNLVDISGGAQEQIGKAWAI
jgi:hypothetical protein